MPGGKIVKRNPMHFSYGLLGRLLPVLLLLTACQTPSNTAADQEVKLLQGETMGTYYRILYTGEEQETLQTSVEQFLVAFNAEVSTYIPDATISLFNQDKGGDFQVTPTAGQYFRKNFQLASRIYRQSSGYFDPTVMPLVNYWGFGYTPKRAVTQVDSVLIDSIMAFVGFDMLSAISENPLTIQKMHPNLQLDFSAVAKGQAIDEIGHLLEQKGISNYFIDIGGEVLARGNKGEQGPWRVAIAVPDPDASATEAQAGVELNNQAIASSGNYRNYHDVNGQKYGHTINPFTGYPELSRLLGVSILAKDCATADAFATACMVAGLENGFQMIDTLAGLEGFFIYADENNQLQTKATVGFTTFATE